MTSRELLSAPPRFKHIRGRVRFAVLFAPVERVDRRCRVLRVLTFGILAPQIRKIVVLEGYAMPGLSRGKLG